MANISHDHINFQVFRLLEDLEAAGQTSSPRGLVTKEANLATLDIDPLYSVMDFSPRKFNWKYFAGELAWYIKADPSIEFINNFSSFWKGIVGENGSANSNYGNLLFKIHPSTFTDDFEYGGGINTLEWAYQSLINDSNTRQAVAFFNAPCFQIPGNKDFVCTMYVNFWIRKGYLDMKVQMRSNDIFFGLTYDAPWFSTLMQSMYLNLKKTYPDLRLGMYYHCADNIHFYERHFEMAEKIMDSILDDSIKLELKYPIFEFESRKDGSSKLVISSQATDYVNKIDNILEEFRKLEKGGSSVETTVDYWKEPLGMLYKITRDSS